MDSPLAAKLKAIETLSKEFGIHAPCRVLEVRRSTYYHYFFRSPEQTMVQREDERLRSIIADIFMDAKGRLGSKKIRAIMVANGHKISASRVIRLMKEMGLVCVSAKKTIKHIFPAKSNYRHNSLQQQFEQDMPNRVWVSDITYLYANYKPYYLCVIIDLYARKVIGYKMPASMELPIVLDAFNTAYENRGYPEELLFHSDQGSQFSSYEFVTHLRSMRVKQSFSNPGCPYDNAVAESFFRSLKAEEVCHYYYATIEEM